MKKLLSLMVFTVMLAGSIAPCLAAEQWYTVIMKCSREPGKTYTEFVQADNANEAAKKGMEKLKSRDIYPGGCSVMETKKQ